MFDLRRLADDVIEASVVLSFTDLGPAIRSSLFEWEDLDRLDLTDRVVAITGASSGLGLAAATRLATMGAGLRLLIRDEARAAAARESILQVAPGADVATYTLDLSDLAAVRRVADQMTEAEERLDALVNNAGALLPERRVSVDGNEMTFATMVLGPFVLTNSLVPLLARTAEDAGVARVVNVASGGMYLQGLCLDDLQMEREPYRGSIAYARAKRAMATLTREWSRRLRGRAITVNAMHPGWADTPGVVASLPTFHRLLRPRLRTPQEGADTIVWLVASEEPARATGRFWLDRGARPVDRLRRTRVDDGDARRLWRACERLTRAATEIGPSRAPND
jgi:NAD(P)-dependent dehydrogenase (short-subunit alcohol dehydrogenase family)